MSDPIDVQLEKLSPQKGDILIVRSPTVLASFQARVLKTSMETAIKCREQFRDVLILICDQKFSFEATGAMRNLVRMLAHYEKQSQNYMPDDVRGKLMAEIIKELYEALDRDGFDRTLYKIPKLNDSNDRLAT